MSSSKLLLAAALVLGLASGCLANAELPDEWACDSNADCLSGEKCFDATDLGHGQRCKRADYCRRESDCGSDGYCDGPTSTCTHVECKSDAQCGTYRCRLDGSHECYDACSSSGQCSIGSACSGGACVPQQCHDADDASCLGYACNDGICATSCSTQIPCAPGHSCVAASCSYTGENLACTSDFQCTTAPYTHCEAGGCGLACDQRPCEREGAVCPDCDGAPYVCGSNGRCQAACIGVVCGYDGDVYCDGCPPGYTCVNNACTF